MHLLAPVLASALALGPAPEGEADAPSAPVADELPEDAQSTSLDSSGEAPATPEASTEAEPTPSPEAEAQVLESAPSSVDGDSAQPEPEPPIEAEPSPQPPAPSVEAESSSDPLATPAGRDRLGCQGSRSCSRMTVSGIVVGSLGLIGVGIGAGLLATPDRVDPDLPIYVTSTRPAGLVTVTVSAGITVTAVLMLVAAHRGYKQRDLARVELMPGGLRF